MSSSLGFRNSQRPMVSSLPTTRTENVKVTVSKMVEEDECEDDYSFFTKVGIKLLPIFLVWGLLTSFFFPSGWTPESKYATMVDPGILQLIPFVLAYVAGELMYEGRGGCLATFIVLASSLGLTAFRLEEAGSGAVVSAVTTHPMVFNALFVAPLIVAGYGLIAEKLWKPYVLEPLSTTPNRTYALEIVDSIVYVGLVFGLSLAAFEAIPHASDWFGQALGDAAKTLTDAWPPLGHLVIELGKVLFLNNAINTGVLVPLGMADIASKGKSLWFMLETNPGPGAGVLFAFLLTAGQFDPSLTCGKLIRRTVPLALIIHLFGGIHEVYFLYVLMRPRFILALIVGGFVGTCIFVWGDAGYTAPPSPGSLMAMADVTPSGDAAAVIFGILLAALASFATSLLLLRPKVNLCIEQVYNQCSKILDRK